MTTAGIVIRRARSSDAAGVLTIYEPIVTRTPISFETVPPDAAELSRRIESANSRHAWLVAEADGTVTGYAYAGRHRDREAYRYSVETSVYVHPDHYGRGIGSSLYRQLFDELTRLGFHHAYAGITLPNDASVTLHRRAGFRHVGTFPKVGFKLGRWHDVAWWYRPVQAGTPDDSPDTAPAISRRGARRD